MDKNYQVTDFKRVAFVGNFLPRKCGIATFTTDLSDAFSGQFPQIQSMVVAMNDVEEGYPYPDRVRYEINQNDLLAYERAAAFLNQHNVDVINLQHEYGIFGGPAGANILTFLRNAAAPVVTTLHTVLEHPDREQFRVLHEIGQLSNRLIVMSERSREFLERIYSVPAEKIDLIPHGIHDVPFVDPGFYKDAFDAEGKYMLLTFGLLAPNKGIEYVIESLPAVLERHPNLVYYVVGATHPHVVKHAGESYREGLQARARELGIEQNVRFHNKFVDLDELKEYIGAADIYITPYLNAEQAVSGTLAYTVGAGKAVISTPYWHAEELLDARRGMLVPFRDSAAISEKILYLLENEPERSAMRKRAYLYARSMVWENVAERYLNSFRQARQQDSVSQYSIAITGASEEQDATPPRLNLDHLERMTDSTGMFQHAIYSVPNFTEGYTTDDNARGLIVTVQLEEMKTALADQETYARVQNLAHRYLAFLLHAFNSQEGRFRNFMAYDRRWLEEIGSEDSHGRAIWALGYTLGRSKREGLQGAAHRLFEVAVPVTVEFTSPRAWAFTLLGIHHYLKRFPGDRAVAQVQETLVQKLLRLYHETASADWPWFEEIVSYCNPVLPHALLLSASGSAENEVTRVALESLGWLMKIQQSEQGWMTPIGCLGFYRKGETMALFDQQPVEIAAMVSASLEAFRVTKDTKWFEMATRSFGWFFGRNALGLPAYDKLTGGCRDGLHFDRMNENQGAESTLAFLQSLLEMEQIAGLRQNLQGEPVRENGRVSSSREVKLNPRTQSRPNFSSSD